MSARFFLLLKKRIFYNGRSGLHYAFRYDILCLPVNILVHDMELRTCTNVHRPGHRVIARPSLDGRPYSNMSSYHAVAMNRVAKPNASIQVSDNSLHNI